MHLQPMTTAFEFVTLINWHFLDVDFSWSSISWSGNLGGRLLANRCGADLVFSAIRHLFVCLRSCFLWIGSYLSALVRLSILLVFLILFAGVCHAGIFVSGFLVGLCFAAQMVWCFVFSLRWRFGRFCQFVFLRRLMCLVVLDVYGAGLCQRRRFVVWCFCSLVHWSSSSLSWWASDSTSSNNRGNREDSSQAASIAQLGERERYVKQRESKSNRPVIDVLLK